VLPEGKGQLVFDRHRTEAVVECLLCDGVGEDGILFCYGKGNPCVNPINISHNREENRT